MIGIGVITCERRKLVHELLDKLMRLTLSPFALVIADDGSTDGTVESVRDQGYRCITGPRRGVAWNKNRALYDLFTRTECDPILLLEDDCHPKESGWEAVWTLAAFKWHHINAVCYGIGPEVTGENTIVNPWRCYAHAGVCIATTRSGLDAVGYLDTRFHGYGYEHVEWTSRFSRHYGKEWGPPIGTVPCIWHGLDMQRSRSHYDQDQMKQNIALWPQLCHEPVYREPWQTEGERETLQRECLHAGP